MGTDGFFNRTHVCVAQKLVECQSWSGIRPIFAAAPPAGRRPPVKDKVVPAGPAERFRVSEGSVCCCVTRLASPSGESCGEVALALGSHAGWTHGSPWCSETTTRSSMSLAKDSAGEGSTGGGARPPGWPPLAPPSRPSIGSLSHGSGGVTLKRSSQIGRHHSVVKSTSLADKARRGHASCCILRPQGAGAARGLLSACCCPPMLPLRPLSVSSSLASTPRRCARSATTCHAASSIPTRPGAEDSWRRRRGVAPSVRNCLRGAHLLPCPPSCCRAVTPQVSSMVAHDGAGGGYDRFHAALLHRICPSRLVREWQWHRTSEQA